MARCKCKYDKRQIDTKTAFKVVIKDKNTYFCSEDCYDKYLADKAEKDQLKAEYDKIYELSSKIFGYAIGSYSLLKAQIQLIEKTASRQKIIQYLQGEEDFLANVMNREFDDEFCRIRYFKSVITSKIYDYKPKPRMNVPDKKIEACGVENVAYKPTGFRRGLAFLEEDD